MRARLTRIRSNEEGFTLIEVLVVIVIMGVLAAIAIPSFLNQTNKASDASAISLAHTAELAVETYSTDHDGSYVGLQTSTLPQYDPTIQITSGNGAWVSAITNATGSGYSLTTNSAAVNGETFTITRLNGAISRTCTPATGIHGGCTNGTW